MLTLAEKKKVKDILADGLNIRRDINLPYFLDCIKRTNSKVDEINSRIDQIIYYQQCLDQKLDRIIHMLNQVR